MTAAGGVADWRRNLGAVSIATFIGFTAFTLVMPFLPLYFEQLGVRDPGAIAIWSGVSLGITPAITAAMAPAWAHIADRYGRKLMVVRSLASFVVVMSLLAAVQHPWQVLALRAVLGFFAGYGAIAMTMAADSAPPAHLATAIGWVQTAQRLGPAVGPILGGVIAAAVGLREAFIVAAAGYLGAFFLVMIGYREGHVRPSDRPTEDAASPTWRELVRVEHFVLFLGLVFGLQLVDRSIGPVLPLYLGEIGAEAAHVPFLSGLIFTITAGAAAAGNQITSWLLKRQPPARVVAASAAVAAIGAAGFAAGLPAAALVWLAVPFGLGIGVATTSIYTTAGRAISARQRSVGFGYLTTAYLVALAISPVVAGLVGAKSMRAVFVADAVGLAAIAWLARRLRPAPAPNGPGPAAPAC